MTALVSAVRIQVVLR